MSDARPTIYGIPFSHYCQKAEWGLTQAGIDYDYVSISLPQMVRLPDVTPTGLVPAMILDGALMEGSDRILQWAGEHQSEGTAPLYPEKLAKEVLKWEAWAGEDIGPVARREAYRVAHSDPWHFTNRRSVRLAAYLGKNLVLNVLKYYKARRFDESDAEAVPEIVNRVANQLNETGTGFLFSNQPTAADHAVAALGRPLLYAAPGRDYDSIAGWSMFSSFIERVKPVTTTRVRKRRIKDADWKLLASLSS